MDELVQPFSVFFPNLLLLLWVLALAGLVRGRDDGTEPLILDDSRSTSLVPFKNKRFTALLSGVWPRPAQAGSGHRRHLASFTNVVIVYFR